MSPAAKSRTLVRLLDTAGHRPLSDDEFETMKDVAVLDMLCSYWEQALERCARCGVARDLHRQWRVFVDDPFALPDHQFTPWTAPIPDGADPRRESRPSPGSPRDDRVGRTGGTRPSSGPAVVDAPALATLLTATAPATTAATAPAPAATQPAPDPAVPRRSWRQALRSRLRAGQQRPLSQP